MFGKTRKPLKAISADDFDQMIFDSAAVLTKFDMESPNVQPQDIATMTTGDVKVSCKPTVKDGGEEVNGCPLNLKELLEIHGWTVTASFTALTASPKALALALGAATIAGNKVTPRDGYAAEDFRDIYIVGIKNNGGYAVAHIKNAASHAGLDITFTKKAKGKHAVELVGHPSVVDENPMQPPVDFYSTEPSLPAAASVPAPEKNK